MSNNGRSHSYRDVVPDRDPFRKGSLYQRRHPNVKIRTDLHTAQAVKPDSQSRFARCHIGQDLEEPFKGTREEGLRRETFNFS